MVGAPRPPESGYSPSAVSGVSQAPLTLQSLTSLLCFHEVSSPALYTAWGQRPAYFLLVSPVPALGLTLEMLHALLSTEQIVYAGAHVVGVHADFS